MPQVSELSWFNMITLMFLFIMAFITTFNFYFMIFIMNKKKFLYISKNYFMIIYVSKLYKHLIFN